MTVDRCEHADIALIENERQVTDEENDHVGAESDQHVSICSFVVRCDRMWPSTQ